METGYKEAPEVLADQAIELLKTASIGFQKSNVRLRFAGSFQGFDQNYLLKAYE